MKTLDKMKASLNESFRERTDTAFFKVFGVKAETSWNFFANNLATVREDGEELTPAQLLWLAGWSDGYADAMTQVGDTARGRETGEPEPTDMAPVLDFLASAKSPQAGGDSQ